MPKSFDFTDIKKLISAARLTSYQSAFKVSDSAELLGIYNWNLELTGALNSLLQLVEVALRNAINEAGKKNIVTAAGEHWFEKVPFNLVEDDSGALLADGSKPMIIAPQTSDFKAGLAKAKKSAQKILKKKLGATSTAVPTLDQIISQTDFCVWEYILDKSFYDGDANKNFLWPKGFLTAFKKLPTVTGKNKQFQQRDIIRRRIETVRMLRNRVAHNEPIWKDADSDDIADIIQKLQEKVNVILELTFWISPALNNFIKNSSIKHRLDMMLCEHEIKNALYRNAALDISDIATLNQTLTDSKSSTTRVLIKSDGMDGILFSKKNRFN
ncbi:MULTISPECIES: Abi family protein [Enterobacteriaceae]|uniref:Abi family protein n=1 Tax=Enterobacteriaceae TaxID=543 RepID=UPI00034EE85C|nr:MULTISPECIES: Abi family protein [Enterobacteriaceae]AGN84911.1 hypothetical protein H650_06725 [Enterobacter sp. R4-368]NUL39369.1 Abi family protein [Kosakonia sacchari]